MKKGRTCLGEQSVQTMNLLAFFDKGVVLGDSTESEFVHEVDLVRRVHVLVGKVLDRDGEGGGE